MASIERQAATIYREVRQTPRLLRLPSFRAVAAGAVSAILLPLGHTYHQLQLLMTIAGVAATPAQIIAQVAWIRLTIDGDLKIQITGAEAAYLANLYATRNSAAVIQNGILPLFLARPWESEIDAIDGPAYGTEGIDSAQLEVELTGAATINAIVARGLVTKGTPMGRHLCIRRHVDNHGAAGDKEISDFSKRIDIQMYGLHIATGLITAVELRADDVVEWEGAPAFHFSTLRAQGINPDPANWWSLLFNFRGRPLDGLPMVMQDLRLRLTTSGALNNFVMLREQIEG